MPASKNIHQNKNQKIYISWLFLEWKGFQRLIFDNKIPDLEINSRIKQNKAFVIKKLKNPDLLYLYMKI